MPCWLSSERMPHIQCSQSHIERADLAMGVEWNTSGSERSDTAEERGRFRCLPDWSRKIEEPEKSAAGELIKLCRTEDVLEGKPVALEPEGFPPLAAYRIGEEYFVTHNICTHAHSLLTDGFQEGATIECEVHGGTFDIRSGAATGFPCREPLQTYPVSIVEDWIAIAPPEPSD